MHTLAYARFRKTVPMGAVSPAELFARLLMAAAGDMARLKIAMDTGNLEERVALTQKLMDFFNQLGSYLHNDQTPDGQKVYQTLKTYCDGAYVLLSRLSIKNDTQTAESLESSLRTSATILRDMIARDTATQEQGTRQETLNRQETPPHGVTPTTFSA